jgi:hypothetical protein
MLGRGGIYKSEEGKRDFKAGVVDWTRICRLHGDRVYIVGYN